LRNQRLRASAEIVREAEEPRMSTMSTKCIHRRTAATIVLLLAASACDAGGQGEASAQTHASAPVLDVQVPLPPIVEPPLPEIDMQGAKARLSRHETLEAVDFETSGLTIVSGTVVGAKAPAYAVPVAAGQTLTVTFQPTSTTSLYMNVLDAADASGAAVHRGEFNGPTATITAARDTTYVITPHQPRAVADLNEAGAFTMTIARS
jgi:hypothetical protein